MSKYTDRMDDSVKISLHEQGCIRNPKNNKTIMMVFHHFKGRHVAVSTYIDASDVIDALVEINEIDSGFFDFIGETIDDAVDSINSDYLSHYISALNDWNGWFNNNLMYS